MALVCPHQMKRYRVLPHVRNPCFPAMLPHGNESFCREGIYMARLHAGKLPRNRAGLFAVIMLGNDGYQFHRPDIGAMVARDGLGGDVGFGGDNVMYGTVRERDAVKALCGVHVCPSPENDSGIRTPVRFGVRKCEPLTDGVLTIRNTCYSTDQ